GDLSMTPAAQFRPAGPRFRLLFGDIAAGESEVAPPAAAGHLFIPMPAVAVDIFGWGVIYALHARACIERKRVWQAEHYVGAVRDHALSLACVRQGLPAAQARGYDDLSAETLARFESAHVGAAEPAALRAGLAASVLALMREGAEGRLPLLAERHQVVAVDLQGHGRTADIDRPIDVQLMAGDIAALIDHLRLATPDLVGYSLGGGVALHTAAKYPAKVRRLVVASANLRPDAIYPEMRAQQGQVSAAAAEFMRDTPMYQLYQRVAPRPEDFPRLL